MNNIIPVKHPVNRDLRRQINGHRSFLVWFTGLPSSGKSSVAGSLEVLLWQKQLHTYLLDGDNVRKGINANLGFSAEDRRENIRRIGEAAKLFVDAGLITLCAFVSPYREDRAIVRALFTPGDFIEVYVRCPLDVCEKRDFKGHYLKARSGQIRNFTGIDDPYEEPAAPELILDTAQIDIETAAASTQEYLISQKYLSAGI